MDPRRRIEAKASSGSAPRFVLSANEWAVAHRDPDTYEVQFWGGIDLSRTPRDNYNRLRKAGFPIIYRNIPALLTAGLLAASASQYVVAEAPPAQTSVGSRPART